MEYLYLTAIIVASILFLTLGIMRSFQVKSLADYLPISKTDGIKVTTSGAFSASTIATTVSLATIIAAYFNLANFFGLWLAWTAVTGALGMLVVYFFADRMAVKLGQYDYAPSIHEFLAVEYASENLKPIAATLTVIGLLLLLATEFIVGSEFLSVVLPIMPKWVITAVLASVSLAYVCLGGFGTVLKTDRIQMWLIWILIPTLILAIFLASPGESQPVLRKLSNATWFKEVDSGLIWFLTGIFLMNVPTHLSSITIWQRTAACAEKKILKTGLLRSAAGIFFGWGFLSVVAWSASVIIGGNTGQIVFMNLLDGLATTTTGIMVGFFVLLGLYGALLSTSSTLLIAIAHSFTTDIFPRSNDQEKRDSRGLRIARSAMVIGTILSCVFVLGLRYIGFNIEDLIFSIYGGALALFPSIVWALLQDRGDLVSHGTVASFAVVLGFAAGWALAFYGKIYEIQNFVFLSPAMGLGISAIVMVFGLQYSRYKANNHH